MLSNDWGTARRQEHTHENAEMIWALRCLGASIFFPEYKLPQGETLGYAQLQGRRSRLRVLHAM
jgi:hypothetical protein